MFNCKEGSQENERLPKNNVSDSLYGIEIIDPYRYIENLNDTVALNWYKQQTKIAKNITSKISNKDKILALQNKLNSSDNIKISNLEITNNDK